MVRSGWAGGVQGSPTLGRDGLGAGVRRSVWARTGGGGGKDREHCAGPWKLGQLPVEGRKGLLGWGEQWGP